MSDIETSYEPGSRCCLTLGRDGVLHRAGVSAFAHATFKLQGTGQFSPYRLNPLSRDTEYGRGTT